MLRAGGGRDERSREDRINAALCPLAKGAARAAAAQCPAAKTRTWNMPQVRDPLAGFGIAFGGRANRSFALKDQVCRVPACENGSSKASAARVRRGEVEPG